MRAVRSLIHAIFLLRTLELGSCPGGRELFKVIHVNDNACLDLVGQLTHLGFLQLLFTRRSLLFGMFLIPSSLTCCDGSMFRRWLRNSKKIVLTAGEHCQTLLWNYYKVALFNCEKIRPSSCSSFFASK